MRKATFLSLILLIAVCTLSCAIGATFAFPTTSNFELIFPTENYYQIDTNSILATDSSTLAIYNPTIDRITVFGESSYVLICNEATSLVVFGDYIFAKNSLGYEQFDLTTKSSLGQAELVGAPDNYILYSNGNTLFAVNDFGAMRAYSSDFNFVATTNSTALIDSTIASKNTKLYSIDYSNSINKFVVQAIDALNSCSQTEILQRDENYTHFSVDNYIYVAYSRNNMTTVSIYSIGGAFIGTQSFDYEIKTMIASESKIYVLNKASTAVYCYSILTASQTVSFQLDRTIASKSNDNTHLSSPSDILKIENTTYIADTENNRLVTLTKTNESTAMMTIPFTAPTSIAQGANGVYVASQNRVSFVKNGEIEYEISLSVSDTILSVATTDKLYALTSNAVFVLEDGTFKVFKSINDAVKLAASANGNILYVLTSTTVKAFNEEGKDISTPLTFSENSVADIDIDYVGNLYAITTSGKLVENIRSLGTYQSSTENQLMHETVSNGTPTALSIGDDGRLYFATSESFVAFTSIFAPATSSSFTPTTSPQINASTQIFTAETNKTTFFLLDPKNYEYIEEVEVNTIVVCFEDTSENANFVYAIYGTKIGYINKEDLTETTQELPVTTNVKTLHPLCKIYLYPLNSLSTPSTIVEKGTVLEIIGNVSNFTNPSNWFMVKYNSNQIGYIIATDVTDNNGSALIEGYAVYGKAKASRIGERVSIYALPDSDSSVLDSVTDGTELQVLDESTYEGYIKVKCGSIVGYVLANEIKMGGLTTAQIIALVISCVTAVVALAIFIVTSRLKKQAE
ncbi:MAG: hypothetical protein PHE93_03540 [Clostridia bacterium]|nr:hypothetical protein [Clostridia bacterium]